MTLYQHPLLAIHLQQWGYLQAKGGKQGLLLPLNLLKILLVLLVPAGQTGKTLIQNFKTLIQNPKEGHVSPS